MPSSQPTFRSKQVYMRRCSQHTSQMVNLAVYGNGNIVIQKMSDCNVPQKPKTYTLLKAQEASGKYVKVHLARRSVSAKEVAYLHCYAQNSNWLVNKLSPPSSNRS